MKIFWILTAVMWGFGLMTFLIDPTDWVSRWPGITSVASAYLFAIMSVLEDAFPHRGA